MYIQISKQTQEKAMTTAAQLALITEAIALESLIPIFPLHPLFTQQSLSMSIVAPLLVD